MAKIIKKKCCLCGKEYETYCPSCRESVNEPAYKISFDSENCSKVYEACAGFFGKAYTDDEAKALLDICDLTDKENFTPSTKNLIKQIYSAVSPTPQNVVEEKPVEAKADEVKQTTSYNKNKKNKRR